MSNAEISALFRPFLGALSLSKSTTPLNPNAITSKQPSEPYYKFTLAKTRVIFCSFLPVKKRSRTLVERFERRSTF